MNRPDEPELAVDDYCFACGRANPKGLHLAFRFEGDDYVCDFTPAKEYQGWTDIVHGGIVATVLDEVMTRLLWEKGLNAVTAELHIRLKRPVPVGQSATARARLIGSRRRIYETEAELTLADGTLAATAHGKFMRVELPADSEAD
jgi:uncharacterized protein (TIGR00369 family)